MGLQMAFFQKRHLFISGMAFLEMTLKCWIVFGYDISLVLDLWMEKSRNIEFQQMTSAIRPSATGNLIHGLQVMGTRRWAKRHSFGKKY